MAYSGGSKYKSRREKYKRSNRNVRMLFIFAFIAIAILVYRNWYRIYDYISLWFY